MRNTTVGFTIVAMAAQLNGVASAHHSQVMFDMSKCVTMTGTVHTFQFQFPHSWLWVVVPNAKGGMDTWGFESSAPAQMTEIETRWKRDVVKKGDKVTVRVSPMKDGRTGGALATLTLPDGSTLRAATPACAKEMGAPSPANRVKK
jgi:hypothetical protein